MNGDQFLMGAGDFIFPATSSSMCAYSFVTGSDVGGA